MTLAFVSLIGASFFYPDLRAGDVPIQLLMVLPVIGFTFNHGWRGAAVGIPALNLAVHLCAEATGLPGSFDPSTFKNQLTLAMVGATLILFGTASPEKRKSEGGLVPLSSVDRDMHQFSQQSLEMTLRRHVLGIRHVYEDIDRAVCDLADWLQERGYFEMAKATRQLATITSREMRDRSSLIYPTSLEHVGLYLALQVGGIGQEWRTSTRVATHQLSGDPCRLSLAVQLAAYRSITEAMSLMLEAERGPVRLRAKCGAKGGDRGIVIVVGLLNEDASLSRAFRQTAFERLAASAATYGGKVECKRNRLRMHRSDPG